MPQTTPLATCAVNPAGQQAALKLDPNKALLASNGGISTALALGAATTTVIKAVPGRACKIAVLVAGSAVGAVYDSALTTGNSTANQIFVIPNTVGIYSLDFVCNTGIVVQTGTGQTVSVSYV